MKNLPNELKANGSLEENLLNNSVAKTRRIISAAKLYHNKLRFFNLMVCGVKYMV